MKEVHKVEELRKEKEAESKREMKNNLGFIFEIFRKYKRS
jgi:hypothetical protein